ncbi:semaphorin-5A-like [Liolophura sinensis]|uniref:semaphorin-5A-like n=1 Tax=Liolophura sinensis TaxID=3198878 RepID=UPI0031586A8D
MIGCEVKTRLLTVVILGVVWGTSYLGKADILDNRSGPEDYRKFTYDDLLQTQVSVFSHPDILDNAQLTIDMPRNQLLVGARECLFRLSLEDLSELEMADWKSNNMTKLICRAKGQPENLCHNFVRVLIVYDGEVFTCGTNAFSPECSWRKAENLNTVKKWIPGLAKCPYDPDDSATALMTREGDFYSATVMDITARDPAIYRIMGPSRHLRTVRNSKWLNEPEFVSAYEIDDFVYFFFKEAAIEYINCGKKVFSRVARLCKTDNGGQFLFEDNWTTFLKARLNCSIPGEYPFYFDEIQSTFYMPEEDLFYAVFTTPSNSVPGSAVCAYNMTSLHLSFTGPYKHQENAKSAWEAHTNPKPMKTCTSKSETRKRSHQNANNEVHAMKYQLMDRAIQPLEVNPLLVGFNERWDQIVVDHVQGKHHQTFAVVFVSAWNGKVQKMVQLPGTNTTCLIEEMTIIPSDSKEKMKSIQILKDKSVLFVSTTQKVLRVPVHRCERFKTRDLCIQAMDPYCGWDSFYKACTTAPGGNPHVHYWHQHINSCPILEHPVDGGWSRWTDWARCQQVGHSKPGEQCWCRTRACDNPKPFFGGRSCVGSSVQVTNCTVNGEWTSWSHWSSCSRTCGTAIQSRQRWCGNPPPAHGGRICVGPERDEIYCVGNSPCPEEPVHGNWSSWSAWSQCTARCNGGIQTRRRICDRTRRGGKTQQCVGNQKEWRMCNPHSCDVLKKTTHWSPWVQTNKTKGGFFEQRFRFVCRASVPKPDMMKSSFMKTDVRFCFDDGSGCHDSDLPLVDNVDGSWSDWSDWNDCDQPCDGGLQWRRRQCDNPTASGDGQECQGHAVEARHCNQHSCQGIWSCWSELSSCSVSCGQGVQKRTRLCQSSHSQSNFSKGCPGQSQETVVCENPNCPVADAPIHGAGEWSHWSPCTRDHVQYRHRYKPCHPHDAGNGTPHSTTPRSHNGEHCMEEEVVKQQCIHVDPDLGIGVLASVREKANVTSFEAVHLIAVGMISFVIGGVVSVGVVLYVQRQGKAQKKNNLDLKNNRYDHRKNSLYPMPSEPSLNFLNINLNNRFYSCNSLNKDKMTVKEATLKRNSMKRNSDKKNSPMRTNLAINDL